MTAGVAFAPSTEAEDHRNARIDCLHRKRKEKRVPLVFLHLDVRTHLETD